jgi:hypothetical protein
MLTWLNLPETRDVLALRESAAYAHARHVAALNIGHAVETVASIVRDYNTTRPEREAQHRKSPGSAHRAATNARKAAWLLLQFARIVPVNEADLRRATGCLSASAKNTTSTPSRAHRTASVNERMSDTLDGNVSERSSSDSDSRATGCLSASANDTKPAPSSAHRTAIVSERMSASSEASVSERTSSSRSSLPSPTLHSASVLLDLPLASALKADANSPLASSLKDDANSPSSLKADANPPRVACLHEVQACSEDLTSSLTPNSPHGCSRAAMPPDQINAAPSLLPVPYPSAPCTPTPSLCHSVTPSLASRGPPW